MLVGAETFAGDSEERALGDAVRLRPTLDPAARVYHGIDGDLGRRNAGAGQENER